MSVTDMVSSQETGSEHLLPSQACATCGQVAGAADTSSYPPVYALGKVDYRFPTLGTEKELAQAIGHGNAAGLTDRRAVLLIVSE
jgi:hypothetical protein